MFQPTKMAKGLRDWTTTRRPSIVRVVLTTRARALATDLNLDGAGNAVRRGVLGQHGDIAGDTMELLLQGRRSPWDEPADARGNDVELCGRRSATNPADPRPFPDVEHLGGVSARRRPNFKGLRIESYAYSDSNCERKDTADQGQKALLCDFIVVLLSLPTYRELEQHPPADEGWQVRRSL
jgi:hypothetical protein